MTVEQIASIIAHADGRHIGTVSSGCPRCAYRDQVWRLVIAGHNISHVVSPERIKQLFGPEETGSRQ